MPEGRIKEGVIVSAGRTPGSECGKETFSKALKSRGGGGGGTTKKRKATHDVASAAVISPPSKKSRASTEPKEHCANCGELFAPAPRYLESGVETQDRDDDDSDHACTYHDGDLEPDDDFFADHDEQIHGETDCEETRQEYPEGFIWDCCGGKLSSLSGRGCQTGRHVVWSGLLS